MKKNFILGLLFIFPLSLFAQGIIFEQGKLNDVLEKAKKENKLVFIDVYTSWCRPCKEMAKTTFQEQEVGSFYNTNFINFKIDGEMPEGILLVKKYQVNGFPNYLYLNGEGNMVYRSVGAMPGFLFISQGENAIKESKDPRSLAVLDRKYPSEKTNKKFLKEYMAKRLELNLYNAIPLDNYLKLIAKDVQKSPETLTFLLDNFSKSINEGSETYKFLLSNESKIKQLGFKYTQLLSFVVSNAYRQALESAVNKKDEAQVAKAITINNALKIPLLDNEQVWLGYYKATGQKEKYMVLASIYAENKLMKLSLAEIKNKDAVYFQEWEKAVIGGLSFLSTEQQQTIKEINMKFFTNKYVKSLNEIAWFVFQVSDTPEVVNKALLWSKRSLELSGEKDPIVLNTYANLLCKVGKVEEALTYESKAVQQTTDPLLKAALLKNFDRINAVQK